MACFHHKIFTGIGRFLFSFVLILASTKAKAPDIGELLQSDNIDWKFEEKENLIVIGDIHGDSKALVKILQSQGVIDENANWIAKDTDIVLLGDLDGKGPEIRKIADLCIRWKEQAEALDSRLHELLGNHDVKILQGDLSAIEKKELKTFKDFRSHPLAQEFIRQGYKESEAGYLAAFSSADSIYAQWLSRRNTIVQIGRKVFVHGGMRKWILETDAGAVNATVRAWLRYYQCLGPNGEILRRKCRELKPAESTEWLMKEEKSPFIDRELANEKLGKGAVEKILKFFGADLIFLGHTPTPSGLIEQIYDGRVVLADTGIGTEGHLSAVSFKKGVMRILNKIFPTCHRLSWKLNPD